ncbi:ScbA/BarX family gamma-butyrolactone biosynthesis protein [Kitasatospora mediocidica]|uniref:ScbA/BarX family gamma-butyrolactone biosynthesis protein n=1 Tax=Kitasatospora mediocidica TaxID=58352 RepID=UPI00068E3B25|nr:ScbA/BarX family gamma-butyrolactone biosynthesis protein [Kitasatospora mediocidica]
MYSAHHPSAGAAAPAAAADELSYDACVPRGLVHKKAVSEVFLTDARPRGADRFAVAAQWPRDHVFFHPGQDGRSDPLLWVETARQAVIYLSHRFYGVPLGDCFILSGVDFAIDRPQPPRTGAEPLSVTLDATCRRLKQSPGRLVMAMDAVVLVDGVPAGRVGVRWQAVSPRGYRVVRGRTVPSNPDAAAPAVHGTVPLPAQAVGRRNDRDVLLSGALGAQRVWNLRLDTGHPVLFDHGCDHIPGVALIEAFAQAAALAMPAASESAAGGDPDPRIWMLRSGTVSFDAFGELDLPVVIAARPGQDAAPDRLREVTVVALQGEHALATAVLRGAALSPQGRAEHEEGVRC